MTITYLEDLYCKAVEEYTRSPSEWQGLMSCVARFYKYPFGNAVLVYAQKPNTIQLATYAVWNNERVNRKMNRGAKGIAVINMGNPKASLKYLFDLMDTNGTAESFKKTNKLFMDTGRTV